MRTLASSDKLDILVVQSEAFSLDQHSFPLLQLFCFQIDHRELACWQRIESAYLSPFLGLVCVSPSTFCLGVNVKRSHIMARPTYVARKKLWCLFSSLIWFNAIS